jgi:CRISPR/Cas system CMR-associated protein Cmr3 (group 5 of RAMP superfamily)
MCSFLIHYSQKKFTSTRDSRAECIFPLPFPRDFRVIRAEFLTQPKFPCAGLLSSALL